jgi:hypothetical protein
MTKKIHQHHPKGMPETRSHLGKKFVSVQTSLFISSKKASKKKFLSHGKKNYSAST